MSDPFLQPARASNAFDRLHVDVAELFRRHPIESRREWPGDAHPFQRLYSAPLPLPTRVLIWKLLHRLRLDQRWQERFADYWVQILGGRPMLSPDDFHFLRGVYRIRHQDNQIPDTIDPAVHVQAWQQPQLLYQLFAQQFFESIDPRLAEAQWLSRLGVGSFMEFGAASAPVTTAYRQFFGSRAQAILVDLETVAFHYGVFKFKSDARVTPVVLQVANDLLPPPDLRADAIVCKATFEHLKDPMTVVQLFAGMLPPGGHLIFDFLQSEGGGMDTYQAIRQRDAVLEYIEKRFAMVHGDARQHRGSRLTVARLR